jgi:hypothetical protein
MNKGLHVLIDDMRTLDVDIISRNGQVAMRLMEEGEVSHLYMDNDLGENVSMEGIDILKWARDNKVMPPNVTIVSANIVCRKRMEDLLRFDMEYIQDGNWWRKH